MTSKDLDFLNKITNLSNSIHNLYNKLLKLELEGKKDTSEYKEIINCLNIAIEMENRLYLNNNKEFFDYYNYCKNIKLKMKNKTVYNFENILNANSSNVVYERVLNKLNIIKNRKSNKNQLFYDVDKSKICSLSYLEDYSYLYFRLLKEELKKDLLNSFIYFLNLRIDEENFMPIKEGLIKFKYDTIFSNSNIEERLIKNNFEQDKDVYNCSKLIYDLFNLNNENYVLIKDSYYTNLIKEQTKRLIEINDIDYNDINKTISAVLKSIFIKSAVILLNEDSTKEVQDYFKSYLNNDDELILNNISINFLRDIYNSKNKEKEKVLAISLKI